MQFLNVLLQVFALILCVLAFVDFGQAMSKYVNHGDIPYVNIISPILVALAMVSKAMR